jgi:nucleotide-binding universal stress UspA family protein
MSSPIIVGLALREDDDAPLALARIVSGFGASPLVLVHAIRPDLPGPIPIAAYQAMVHREAAEKLDEVASRLPRDLQVSTRVTECSPSHAIQSLVLEYGAVAAVVGSTTRGAVGRVLAGDTAAGLLHDTHCPVVVAPRGYRARVTGTVGVAYNASAESASALTAAVGIAIDRRRDPGAHRARAPAPGAALRVAGLPDHAGLRAAAPGRGADDRRPCPRLGPPRGERNGRGAGGRGRRGARGDLRAARPPRVRLARLRAAARRRRRERGPRAVAPRRVPARDRPARRAARSRALLVGGRGRAGRLML